MRVSEVRSVVRLRYAIRRLRLISPDQGRQFPGGEAPAGQDAGPGRRRHSRRPHGGGGVAGSGALRRELREELNLEPLALRYICTLLYHSQEFKRLHYYAVEAWQCEMENNEAVALLWLPLADPDTLDLYPDRLAVQEYLRVYASQAP